MVGRVQHDSVAGPRALTVDGRAQRDGGASAHARSGVTAKNGLKHARADTVTNGAALEPEVPPPLPLDLDEADLCARLRGVLAKPPRRVPLTPVAPPDVGIKPAATPLDWIAEQQPLAPLPQLALSDTELGAPGIKVIAWVQRSRRERLSAAVRSLPAWLMTIGVIATTLTSALVMAIGVNRSIDLAQLAATRVPSAVSDALIAMRNVIGL